MKRDNDLIRELLLEFEGEEDWLLMTPGNSDEERHRTGHIYLMMDQGLLCKVGVGTFRITSQGHDFLEAIRSETIWSETKEISRDIGGATLGMLGEIALSLLKQKLSEQLGITI